MSNRITEIFEIEAEYYIEMCGEQLGLEDQLAMAESSPESPYKAMDIAEILGKIAERDARIQKVMEA